MSPSAASLLILLVLATATASSPGLEDISAAKELVSEAKSWAQASLSTPLITQQSVNQTSNFSSVTMALSDCAKLYDETEYRLERLLSSIENLSDEDTHAWLSGALANHRSCIDGLGEDAGMLFVGAHRLTASLRRALALSAQSTRRVMDKGVARPRPRPSNGEYEGLLASWNPASSKANFVVAKDGSGTHRTINEAVAALARMGSRRPSRVIIYVKAGVYNENVEIDRRMDNLMFVGDGMDRTVVTGSRNVDDGATTLSSATFGVSGDGFWARDMTFENTAGPQKHQAVALRVSSDRSIFYRCSFKAYQDTLLVHSLRQFYRDCHIYGTIDFIFGDAAVVIQNCDILVRMPMRFQANMVTAQGRDDPNSNTGISIHSSRIFPAPDLAPHRGSFRSFLGRPWKKYSRTVIMKTDLDGLIDPKGWTQWSGNFALSTLFYGEYMNTGSGASTGRRVRWPGFHVLGNPDEANPYSVSRFIQGDSWIPGTGVPFALGI